jgi:glutathione S-transferase
MPHKNQEDIAMLKLYHVTPRATHPGSHNALKVLIALSELNAPCEVIDMDPDRDLRPLDVPYRKLNPNGLTPTLDDDGYILWESSAIMQYLCATRGPTPLLPTDAKARGLVQQWLAWEGSTFTPGLMALFMAKMSGQTAEAELAKVAGLLGILDKQLSSQLSGQLGGQLTGRDFLTGNYSLADIALGCNVAALALLGMNLQAYPATQAWLDRLATRPAWQQEIFLNDYRALQGKAA